MNRATVLIGILIATVGALIAGLAVSSGRTRPAITTEVTEPAALETLIAIPSHGIATSENYVGQRVRLVTGTLKNVSSTQEVRRVDLRIVFNDFDGKPIHESVEKAFESLNRPLMPGSQIRFSIGFDRLPRTWNYRRPDVWVAKVSY